MDTPSPALHRTVYVQFLPSRNICKDLQNLEPERFSVSKHVEVSFVKWFIHEWLKVPHLTVRFERTLFKTSEKTPPKCLPFGMYSLKTRTIMSRGALVDSSMERWFPKCVECVRKELYSITSIKALNIFEWIEISLLCFH